jgi:hypothetical protein
MSKPYYPNNWEMYKEADDEDFIPHTFDELMTWKVAGWELPSSVCCVIRAQNKRTGKIKEFTYQKPSAADKKLHSLLIDDDSWEVTVCDHEEIHFLTRA